MPGERKIRAFIALKTPSLWDDRFKFLQQELAKKLAGAGRFRWVKPEQLHITLRFLGPVTSDQVEEAKAIVARVASRFRPFVLTSQGLGCFPRPAAPRVLWAGIQSEGEILQKLQAGVAATTSRIGQPPDSRPFQPHLTLARIEDFRRDQAPLLAACLHEFRDGIREPWQVTEVILMQSQVSSQGATYVPLLVVPLAPSKGLHN